MVGVEGEDFEGELLGKIFAVYEHLVEGHQDPTNWICKQFFQLMKHPEDNGEPSYNIAPNAIILLLALLNAEGGGVERWGTDVADLSPTDQEAVLETLRAVFR